MVFQVSLLAAVGWDGQVWMPAVFMVFVALVLDMIMKDVEGFQDGCVDPPLTNTLVEDGGHHLSCITLPQIEHVELGGQELSQLDGHRKYSLSVGNRSINKDYGYRAYREHKMLLVHLEWAVLVGVVLVVAIFDMVEFEAALLDECQQQWLLLQVPMVLDQAVLDSCDYDK
ncbi:hypothetical protein IW261DRAFT_1426087 [Armillaria novae-zelandiae]|uniref:Uncharacterized protein n=1 Tax=Armillaria novae-zelandiae TaxID=153914 RepID=A0AA39NNY9_9AGAR|nr:hypothetical protein IW261DRAFT_1426583 [Armillaria novae-zelandiae]KAK0468893.1 hypothetical protein IW261DRAFT_1426087 [Armillaria novae-zelandiae]